MSDTPWPVEGHTPIEAFNRVFGPEPWKAARERAAIELIDSTRGGSQWHSPKVRGRGGEVDFTTTAKLSRARWELEIDARATALLVEQFTAMLVAGNRATSGRIRDPFAPRIQLEPSQLRCLDLNSRAGEAIAVGPDGVLVYDVRVYEHPWTSAAAEPRTAPVAQATNLDNAVVAAAEQVDGKVIKRKAPVAERIAEKLEAEGYLLSPGDQSPSDLTYGSTLSEIDANRTAIGRHYELVKAVTSAFSSVRLGEGQSVDDLANAIHPKLPKKVKSKPLAVVRMIVQSLLADGVRATTRGGHRPADLKMRHR
jgi:hypothetical protein